MATRRTTNVTPVPIEPDERVDFDLDMLVVEDETAPPFRFRWGGQIFEMQLMAAMPLTEQLELQEMTTEQSMSQILGEDTFERLITTKGGPAGEPISTGRMRELIAAWHRHQGLELGESQASPRSSRSTVRRSKRTSRSGR